MVENARRHPDRNRRAPETPVRHRAAPDVILRSRQPAAQFRSLASPVLRAAASLSHPGGNVAGAAIDAAWGLWLKRLQLFHEMVPKAMRLGYLIRRANWDVWEAQSRPGDEFARKLGVTWVGPQLNHPINEAEYRRVFGALFMPTGSWSMMTRKTFEP